MSIFFILILGILIGQVNAQTLPPAQPIPYSQNFNSLAYSSAIFPSGIIGWRIGSSSGTTFKTVAPTADVTLVASSSASTTAGGVHNYNGKIGLLSSGSIDASIALCINTKNYTTVVITFKMSTIRNPYDGSANTRINNVELQYRVGNTVGTFTTSGGSTYSNNTVTQTGTGVITPQNEQTITITLPAVCDNADVVQLRWVQRDVSGSGARPSFAIDDISVIGTPMPFTYRTKQSGNWEQLSTWEKSSDNINYIPATEIPDYNAEEITIQSGHTVALTVSQTVDQLTINGTLVYGNYAGSILTINDGAGVDFTLNGTFEDIGPLNLSWQGNSRWEMGTNGTLIKTRSTSSNNYRDRYNNGISNIPATANWIIRKTGGDNPSLTSTGGMYYPNLTIENKTATAWTTTIGSTFTGSTDYPRIKGNFNVGGTGEGLSINFLDDNTYPIPVFVGGNMFIKEDCTVRNYGTGFEIQGDLTVNGTLVYGTENECQLVFSGSNEQTIKGVGTINVLTMIVNKTAQNLLLNKNLTVDNSLILQQGNIILQTGNILTINNDATVSISSTLSFVEGKLRKIGNQAFTFPVGKSGNYQPISISAPQNTSDEFIAEYHQENHATLGTATDNTLFALSTCEYWTLEQVVGTSQVNVTLGWNSLSCNASQPQAMVVAGWNSSQWTNFGNSQNTGNSTAGTVTSNSTSIFNVFALAQQCNITANAGADITIAPGESVQIGSEPIAGYSYSWSPVEGLSDASIANPVVNTTITTIFTLTINNNIGCVETDDISVRVEVPSTKLTGEFFNRDYISLAETLRAEEVEGATSYEFLITNNELNFSYNYISNNENLSLSEIPGLIWGETYNITVRTTIENFQGNFGEACNVKSILPSGTPKLIENALLNNPQLNDIINEYEDLIREKIDLNANKSITPKTIPVVVHVIAPAGTANAMDWVTPQRVQEQIDILNAAFSGQYNNTSGNTNNTNINFCLARFQSNGTTPVSVSYQGNIYYGITYNVDATNNFANHNMDNAGQQALMNYSNYQNYFPVDEYLNIWVVNSINNGNIAGYSPMPDLASYLPMNGIVMARRFFGTNYLLNPSDNTPTLPNPNQYSDINYVGYERGAVLVHEAGHYLNLWHIFNPGSCADGDYCNDTPPQNEASYGCPSNKNTCTTDALSDQIENYMDYSSDLCRYLFTNDQINRQHVCLEIFREGLIQYLNLQTAGLIVTGGCIEPTLDPTFESINNETQICQGTSLGFNYSQGTAIEWNWTFENLNTGYIENIVLNSFNTFTYSFNELGQWSVVLTVTDNSGATATMQRPSYIFVDDCTQSLTDNTQGNWHFGQYVGLDFSNWLPQQTYSNIYSNEGCASICNNNGILQIYSNGYRAWNNQHSPITDQLNSDISATQSVLIIPYINDINKYYIFTISSKEQFVNSDINNGLCYTVIDMSLPNTYFGGVGMGTISEDGDGQILNRPVSPGQGNGSNNNIKTTEHLAAVPNCNNDGYWILVHGADIGYDNKILAYQLNSTGISSAPITSTSFSVSTIPTAGQWLGQIEVSPNGEKIAITSNVYNKCYLYDFNKATGLLNLVYEFVSIPGYGVSFSPNSEILYLYNNNNIEQIDLNTVNPCNSGYISYKIPHDFHQYGSLQIAPNNKIYITKKWENSIAVINNPNNLNINGYECGFNPLALTFSQNHEYVDIMCQIGLPNMIDVLQLSQQADFDYCQNCTSVHFNSLTCGNTFHWEFYNSSNILLGQSTDENPVWDFQSTGTYYAKLTVDNNTSIIKTIEINIPTCNIISSTNIICSNNPVNYYSAEHTNLNYNWTVVGGNINNPNSPTIEVNWDLSAITHTLNLEVTDPITQCVCNSPTLTMQLAPEIQIDNIVSSSTCQVTCSHNVHINISGGISPYSTSITNGTENYTGNSYSGLCEGEYLITIIDDNNCSLIDNYTLTDITSQTSEVSIENEISCFGASDGQITVTNIGGLPPFSYNWSNGNSTATLNTLVAGTYSVTVTDDNSCSSTASISISQPDQISVNIIGTNVTQCFGQSTGNANITVSGGTSPYSFLWSNGTTTEDLSNIPAGIYSVTVNDANNCQASESVTIIEPPQLATSISGTNILCFGQTNGYIDLTVSGGTLPYTYLWSNGATTEDITSLSAGLFSVTATDANNCTATNSTTINQSSQIVPAITAYNVVCFGQTNGKAIVSVTGGTSPYTYLWSDGQTSNLAIGLSASTYSVTITDANSCTATASANINEPIQLTATPVININCKTNSTNAATVTVSGGITPYTYIWSTGETTQDITNKPVGTYIVTVTDANNCSDIANVTFEGKPVASFTFPSGCNVIGDIPFTNTSTNSSTTTYLWNLGDGTTSNDVSPTHTYTGSGNFFVTLTVTNICGSSESVQEIYIYPDNCACASPDGSVTYTIPDGTVYDASNPAPAAGWTTEKVEGDVIVKSGQVLKININANIQFGPKGRIIIEYGATLNINKYALLTTVSGCSNYMWEGIEVWGNTNWTSTALQGKVNISTATIENAHIAVLSGKKDISQPSNFNLAYSGGLIQANGTIFKNNGIDIKFIKKANTESSANNVTDCQFLGGILNDARYNKANANAYINHPWYGEANYNGRTTCGIWLWGIGDNNLNLKPNAFSNIETGIYSVDAKYKVNPSTTCTFNNLRYGINILNSNATFGSHTITNCSFDNIKWSSGDIVSQNNSASAAIKITGGRYDKINGCKFGNFDNTDQTTNFKSIDLVSATDYNIVNNTFYYFEHGIVANNSHKGGGYIGVDNQNQRNVFNYCKQSIETNNNNILLKLRCNNCTNDQINNINWSNSGYLAQQGSKPPSTNPNVFPYSPFKDRYPAGNLFMGYRKINSSYTYKYFSHDPATNANVLPVNNTSSVVNILPLPGINYNVATSCLPMITEAIPDLHAAITSLNTLSDNLLQQLETVRSSLDNGNTEQLLNAINSNMSSGSLKNLLVQNSPLSDAVLIETITKAGKLVPGTFKEVITPNLPVGDDVVPYLDEKLKTLPQGIANQIKQLQADNADNITVESLSRQLNFNNTFVKECENKLVSLLIDDNQLQEAMDLLIQIYDENAKQILASAYITESNITEAESVLSDIEVDGDETADWLQFSNILLQLQSTGKGYFEINSADMAFIRELAYKCHGGLATANAQAILSLVYHEEVPPCDNLASAQNRNMKIKIEVSETKEAFANELELGDNIPNPFSQSTVIPYSLPENVIATLTITDVTAKKIAEYQLKQGRNTVEIKRNKLAPGVYYYSLNASNGEVITKRMIIIN